MTWIDIEAPTRDEIASVMEEYNLPAPLKEDLLNDGIRSKVDRYQNVIYLVLHFPTILHHGKNHRTEVEVDFIIGKDFMITSHYQTVNGLHEFAKKFEVTTLLERDLVATHAGFLFYYAIRELYHHALSELDIIDRDLIETEKSIFADREEKMVRHISALNRKLLDFRQAIRFHHDVLTSFEKVGEEFFGKDFSYYLSAIVGEFSKVRTLYENHKEMLVDLRETNDSLLTSKTNDTMKTLTTMNFIVLPAALISWIFSMNSSFPLIQDVTEFYLVIGAMILIGVLMFIYFKKRKWL